MTASPSTVLLFRSPTSPPDSDPYQVLFTRYGNGVESIAVLAETFSTDELGAIIEHGPGSWEGVVLMSRRGAEGWVRAAQGVLGRRRMFREVTGARAVEAATGSEVDSCVETEGDSGEHDGGWSTTTG